MLNSAPPPPSAEKLSCIELTAPVDVAVVLVAKSADGHTPKRSSLPSIPPSGPDAACTSDHVTTVSMRTHSVAMKPRTVQP